MNELYEYLDDTEEPLPINEILGYRDGRTFECITTMT